MSTTVTPSGVTDRPSTITGAVWLLVLVAAITVPTVIVLMDGFDAGFVPIAATLATLKLIGAAGLWRCRKWAMMVAFGATLLDTLFAAGSIPDLSGGETVAVTAIVLVGIVTLVLLVLPASRKAYV